MFVTTGRTPLQHVTRLTETDRAIIAHLQEDGRRPFVEISRQIGVTEKTVRARVQELLRLGAFQITAVTDPAVLGYEAAALLGLKISAGALKSGIADHLAAIDEVDYVCVTTGRYGIMVEVICRDIFELQSIVDTKIGSISGIASIEAFPFLSLSYQQPGFSTHRPQKPKKPGVRPKPLSGIDKGIVRALSYDGRAPIRDIAESLGISQTQVRNRINEMTSSGVLSIMAIINAMSFEYGTMAWLAIRGGNRKITDIANDLVKIPAVSYLVICAGRFDIFAEFACISTEELQAVIDNDVRAVTGIEQIETFLYTKLHYKRLLPARDVDEA
ncbi:Lrp/AsnC family transcriptional regulator [Methyloligella sp. 2.7D]|uniref:Lrp/AsnC family transcriptional regulator n=1 Tax=unclassified Methyloligella TaxID=2625955 RepID=UPI00157BF58A|nr:Lrp/AsnC family transcriptional regulator [Methyloligella sp. GL2]QKP76957.1 Lrp/AsnC family transcriptional regulator [Methyloligella sp. GL2]